VLEEAEAEYPDVPPRPKGTADFGGAESLCRVLDQWHFARSTNFPEAAGAGCFPEKMCDQHRAGIRSRQPFDFFGIDVVTVAANVGKYRDRAGCYDHIHHVGDRQG